MPTGAPSAIRWTVPVRSWAIAALCITVVAIVLIGAVLLPALTRATPRVRERALDALNRRFTSEVTLSTLEVTAFPTAGVAGGGLVFRHRGRRDVPPLIEVPEFSATAGFVDLWGRPIRLRTVELEGLSIHIPAGGRPDLGGARNEAADDARAQGRPGDAALIIDRLASRSAALEIASKDPARLPRRFEIHDLEMRDLGRASGAPFHASLTNPKPHGSIRTEGVFGPWHAAEPRATPVRGTYRFEDADLDTIKGIGGILSSAGAYRGVLERIEIAGRTTTPDFSIDVAGRPVPLDTTFDAVVDGTNGNTWLERVDATLGRTPIRASGAVVRAREVKGRHIALDVAIDDGRLEDVLSLAVDAAQPPMAGRMSLNARVVIPAGDEDVVDKLRLDGRFELAQARFASFDIQRRVNALSRRGQGDTGDDGPSVVSRLRGRFVMDGGTIRFSSLTFGVPGATVQLAGAYNLRTERIDFAGDLLLDASLRETTTGWKSVVAWLAQPLFRRPGGGSKLPIRISGSRSKPSFGLDVKRALLPG